MKTAIQNNLDALRAHIEEHAQRSGRSGEAVRLIAVTKTRSPQEISQAVACGVRDLGENKVQEFLGKYDEVMELVSDQQPLRWHLIGHLQRNKVRQIIDKVYLIHSVDSLRLAREIDKRAKAADLQVRVLVQVNAAGEESKFGVAPEAVKDLVLEILDSCPNIRIMGLMHMAPLAQDPEEVRHYFTEVKELYDQLSALDHPALDFSVLSMGMSGDYGVAIEEGATDVRIGTAVFGERDYSTT